MKFQQTLFISALVTTSLLLMTSSGFSEPVFHSRYYYTTASGDAGTEPVVIKSGDLNNDDEIDLVTFNRDQLDVSVLLGNGGGSFQSPLIYSTLAGPLPIGNLSELQLAIEDLNGDTFSDILTMSNGVESINPNASVDTLNVLFGNGDGTFQSAVELEADLWSPQYLSSGDLNSDGFPDIIFTQIEIIDGLFTGVLSFLEGNGDGTFKDRVRLFDDLEGPGRCFIIDVNGDGVNDLLFSNRSRVRILYGRVDGTLEEVVEEPFGNFASNPSLIKDFDGDGLVDSITSGSGSFFINFGSLNGTFRNTQFVRLNQRGSSPTNVISLDFNNDGDKELFASGFEGFLLHYKGNQSYRVQEHPEFSIQSLSLISDDFNDDQNDDIAFLNGDSVGIQLSTGKGDFVYPENFEFSGASSNIAQGDVNNDGKKDFILWAPGLSTVTFLMVLEGGDITEGLQLVGNGESVIDAILSDLNGDGNDDILTASSTFGLEQSGSIGYFESLGDGTFKEGVFMDAIRSTGPEKLLPGFFNSDQLLDVAYVVGNDTLAIITTDESGNLLAPQQINIPGVQPTTNVLAADLNDDQLTDILFSGIIVPGHPDTFFGNPIPTQFEVTGLPDPSPDSLTIGNLNGDQLPDLILSGEIRTNFKERFTVLENQGNFNFGTGILFSPDLSQPSYDDAKLISGDFDKNGKLDLYSPRGSLFWNYDQGTFEDHAVTEADYKMATDFDGDGDVDLITTARFYDQAQLRVLYNLTETADDVRAPESEMIAPEGLVVQKNPVLQLRWIGKDNPAGSGLDSVEVFYSLNESPFQSLGEFTRSPIDFDTSLTGGEGHYSLYSVAKDSAGNTEKMPLSSDIEFEYLEELPVVDSILVY